MVTGMCLDEPMNTNRRNARTELENISDRLAWAGTTLGEYLAETIPVATTPSEREG
jgi:hypothetical protein